MRTEAGRVNPSLVAVGGGSGLAVLLRGLKSYYPGPGRPSRPDRRGHHVRRRRLLGRLRRELGVLPPGDIRNCIVALADDEDRLARLFQYRFPSGNGLSGHSFGNLFLTALTGVTGDFYQAILTAESILSVRGRILPATLRDVRLRGEGALRPDLRRGVGGRQLGRAADRAAARAARGVPAFRQRGRRARGGRPDRARARLALHLDPAQPADHRHPRGDQTEPRHRGADLEPDDPARRNRPHERPRASGGARGARRRGAGRRGAGQFGAADRGGSCATTPTRAPTWSTSTARRSPRAGSG